MLACFCDPQMDDMLTSTKKAVEGRWQHTSSWRLDLNGDGYDFQR